MGLSLPPLSMTSVGRQLAQTRAHSKVALRVHGMDEVGVRFPVGPETSPL